MDLIADLEARGLIHDSTDREFLRAQVGRRAGPVGDLLRLRPDGRQPARRQPDRARHAAPLPDGRPPADRPGGRCDGHGRRPERTVRGAQPARRRRRSTTTWPRSRSSSAASSTSTTRTEAKLVDNRDWTQPITLLEFLRDVGKHVTVNQMLARESVQASGSNSSTASRSPSSATCCSRPTTTCGCTTTSACEIQIGGSDQWGNIIAGVDLIRRKRRHGTCTRSPGRCCSPPTARSSARPPAPGVARSRQDQPVPVPPALDPDRRRRDRAQLLTFSLRPVDELERAPRTSTTAAPARAARPAGAGDEMTELVHGAEAAQRRRRGR